MKYTHDFDFIFDGIHLEGEMLLDGFTMVKINCGAEMTMSQRNKVQQLFEVIECVSHACSNGGIVKLELIKKE